MLFSQLSEYLEKLEKVSSRISITEILSDLFKNSDLDEVDKTTYLILGELAPSYKGIVFNIADKMMIKSLSIFSKKEVSEITALYKQKGDLGNVAQELVSSNSKSKLSVSEVYQKLLAIALDSGEGSQDRKIIETSKLISELDSISARFIARIPVGKLRLGFSERTIIDSLSWMETGGKSRSKELENAYNVLPDIGLLVKAVKEKGIDKAVKEVNPVVGIPVVPMLAQRLKTASEMIKKMGEVSVEPKFDGLRILIHFKQPDNIKIFTRNLNYLDPLIFPELSQIGKYIKAKEIILDTEAVGMDEQRIGLVDFQQTIQRRRKHQVNESSSKTPLQFQAFDILYMDGESLLNKPYLERRERLTKVIENGPLIRVDENTVTTDPKVINELHAKYTSSGYEGILVKKTSGMYVSGRTGWNWVKMKDKEGVDGKLSDTVDCVVMGYSVGKGKRAGFGVGQFLVGIRSGEKIVTVTKVGTGITDLEFRELNERLTKIKVNEKPKEYEVNKILEPDFWVSPSLVVEIAADEITKSPSHTAGLALRFPRLIKFRDDKSVKEATTTSELKDLFRIQKRV